METDWMSDMSCVSAMNLLSDLSMVEKGPTDRGASPVAALSETKREFIRGDAGTERKSPAVWAPFVYYGD
jgi:hypothetical protein